MNKLLSTLLLVAITGVACKPEIDSRYYKDIDLLNIRGENEVLSSELKFPYLRIDSIGENEKRVTYFVSEGKSAKYLYKKRGNEWVWRQRVDEPDTVYYYFKLIDENKSVTYLKYGAADPFSSDSAYLVSVGQFDGVTRSTYIFGRGVMAAPSTNLASFPLNRYSIKVVENFKIENGEMKVEEDRHLLVNDSHLKMERCFEINNQSIYWYLECHHLLPRVECD